ncbi:hypothetical protein WN55_08486 [Dufourea novaeangliae]|uniref:Uncharacterized protein n=1 Tax=Dufourea novaeangliae TaxID=178035 RepID=A0A154P6Y6_DUFNO|nr:hypothetical protein WN55_08486 [Dufourea novaeangliae]
MASYDHKRNNACLTSIHAIDRNCLCSCSINVYRDYLDRLESIVHLLGAP